jgi:hypothetical protein
MAVGDTFHFRGGSDAKPPILQGNNVAQLTEIISEDLIGGMIVVGDYCNKTFQISPRQVVISRSRSPKDTPEDLTKELLSQFPPGRLAIAIVQERSDEFEVHLCDKSRITFARQSGKGKTIGHALQNLFIDLFGEDNSPEFPLRVAAGFQNFVWNAQKSSFVPEATADSVRQRAEDCIRTAEVLRQTADLIEQMRGDRPVHLDLSSPLRKKKRAIADHRRQFETVFNIFPPSPPFSKDMVGIEKVSAVIQEARYEKHDRFGFLCLSLTWSVGSGVAGGAIVEPYASRILTACGLTKKTAKRLSGRKCYIAAATNHKGSTWFLSPDLTADEAQAFVRKHPDPAEQIGKCEQGAESCE